MWNSFRRWYLPPVYPEDDDKSRSASLINGILWVFFIATALYGLFAPVETVMRWRRAVIIVPFILMLLGIKQVLNHGYIRQAGWMIVFSLWLIFTGAMGFGADYQNPAYMGCVIVVICAGLILHWRAAIGWSILSIITNSVILYLGGLGILEKSDGSTPASAFWAAQTIYIFVASILISQTLRKIDEALAKAQRELNKRKRVEAEREQIIKELESKNAELERFTYTVSHDLKSPLITIGGFIGLLWEDARAGNTDKVEKDLHRIREAKDKMDRLLNELLELSRIGRIVNAPATIPFAQIVDEALSLANGRISEGNIRVETAKDFPNVTGDYPRLVEIMQNLIDNAAKFTSTAPDPKIEIGWRNLNGETLIFVKDNGIGIDPVYYEKIFGLFNKLDPGGEGTGIGLTLVKRIVEVHGGRIWVESQGKETGSTFLFTLPHTNSITA